MSFKLLDDQLAHLEKNLEKVLPRGRALLVAGKDKDVREKLQEKLDDGSIFREIEITQQGKLADIWLVEFEFVAAPGAIVIHNPTFAVLVSISTKKVLEIIDPHM